MDSSNRCLATSRYPVPCAAMPRCRSASDIAAFSPACDASFSDCSRTGTAVALSCRTTWWKQPTQNSASAFTADVAERPV